MPGDASYAATKAMVSNFMTALSYEVREKIDVSVWEPGLTYTNIFPDDFNPPSAVTMSSKKAVSGALRHVGRSRQTYGNFFFLIQGSTTPSLWLLGNAIADESRRKFKKNKM